MTGAHARSGGGVVVVRGVHRINVREVEQIERLADDRETVALADVEGAADAEVDVLIPWAGKRIASPGTRPPVPVPVPELLTSPPVKPPSGAPDGKPLICPVTG